MNRRLIFANFERRNSSRTTKKMIFYSWLWSVSHVSAKSPKELRNPTVRNRSRTTKIVMPGFGLSAGSHFSAETPIDFATSQARNSSGTIKIMVCEPPCLDQKSSNRLLLLLKVLARLERQVFP